MTSLRERIVAKLQDLPEPDLREVLTFVDFLTWRTTREEEPLLTIAGSLAGESLSARDIEDEIYGDAGRP
jgi:hypothetical protein